MKKLATILITGLFLTLPTLLVAKPVLAFDPFGGAKTAACKNSTGSPSTNSPVCSSSANRTDNPLLGPNGTLSRVTNLLGTAGGAIAVVMIIINGGRFVLAGGNAEKVESARNGVIYAVIGLVVIIVARSIIFFVITRIG